jgi:hypothetical protein
MDLFTCFSHGGVERDRHPQVPLPHQEMRPDVCDYARNLSVRKYELRLWFIVSAVIAQQRF